MKSVVRSLIVIFLMKLLFIPCYAQTIQMEDVGGVYKIPCTVNGLRLKMIFDPGASTVCISESTAIMMLENDYLSKNDIKGTGQSQVADGSVVDHTIITLKTIQIGDKVLNNVEAVVIHGQDAPLLFGQSALRRLGKYSISGNKLIIDEKQGKQTSLTDEEIEKLAKEADKAYSEHTYHVAIEKYQILLNANRLSTYGMIVLGNCYFEIEDYDSALDIYLSVDGEIESEQSEVKAELYDQIGMCYARKNDKSSAIKYYEKCKYYAETWSEFQWKTVLAIASCYYFLGKENMLFSTIEDYISSYLIHKGVRNTDCWDKNLSDEFLGMMYSELAFQNINETELYEKYIIIAAAWGDKKSVVICNQRKLDYKSKNNKTRY